MVFKVLRLIVEMNIKKIILCRKCQPRIYHQMTKGRRKALMMTTFKLLNVYSAVLESSTMCEINCDN